MIDRLPEHLKTGRTARALTLPSAILLAGAGASAAILAGAALPVAAVVAAGAWAARVAMALPRRKARGVDVDPFTVGEPWRTYVQRAVSAHRRFDRAVARTRGGPLRERLTETEDRIRTAVRECFEVAVRGDALDHAVSELNIESIRNDLAQAEHELGRSQGRTDLEDAANALRSQLASAERLRNTALSTSDRLRRLNAELDEAVARTIELSLKTVDTGRLEPFGADVENVVSELEALRQALDETEGGPADATATATS